MKIQLMKLLKKHYTFFYIVIHVSKQFSFIQLSMFPKNSHLYWYLCFQTVSKSTSDLII